MGMNLEIGDLMSSGSILSIIVVMIILIVTKTSGLFRDAMVVSIHGAGQFSDSFFLALSIVLTLYALMGKAITLYLIPRFKQNERDYSLIKTFAVKGGYIAAGIITLYSLFPNEIIGFFYNGDVDSTLLELFTSAIYALVIVPMLYALVAYHQSRNRFYVTSLIGLIFNIAVIVGILFKCSGKMFFVLAILIQVVPLLFNLDIKKIICAKQVKMSVHDFLPMGALAVVMAFEQLNLLIDRKYISMMGSGKLTLLDLGGKVSFMFMGIVVLAITTVLYPKLSGYYHAHDYKKVLGLFKRAFYVLSALSVIGVILVFNFAEMIIEVLFVRGGLYVENVGDIALFLKIYSLALFPLAMRELMARVLILRKKEFVLFGTSIVGLIINMFLSMVAGAAVDIVWGSIVAIVVSTLLITVSFVGERRKLKKYIASQTAE